jgi:hypothetical protein
MHGRWSSDDENLIVNESRTSDGGHNVEPAVQRKFLEVYDEKVFAVLGAVFLGRDPCSS